MPDFGDIIFSGIKAYVAVYNPVLKIFDVPALLEYMQDVTVEAIHDTDMIKAQGANREALSVMIGAKITVKEASMRDDAVNVISGETATQSGASGDRTKTRIRSGGGEGTPYFGIIIIFAATNSGRYVYGGAKCMCQNKPKLEVTQNTFRTGEFVMDVLAIDGDIDNIDKSKKYEDSSSVPDFSVQANFQTYFDEILN